jgi:superfamily II DNA/RNA helicase
MTARPFETGALVRARGREWVVLPETTEELAMLRPLGATEDEVTGILTALEPIESATFPYPDPEHLGDARSARLLRDALRLGFRSSAGPFRSFGRLAVEPRPYQLVPLLMALKLDPVRLLIADDVGIGKTIEAALIARELLDRGDVQRVCVLCPPHLAEQWEEELRTKFHLTPQLVLPSTARRLERGLLLGESLFEVYPQVIVSTDFIKTDRHRADFVRACPDLVIVDEAHTFAFGARNAGRHQRHELLVELSRDPNRHLILVTATPHSGKEDAFRSLLAVLDPKLGELPEDLSGSEREGDRRLIARHLVQRRRADIRDYLGETPFPERLVRDETYELTPEFKALFDQALAWAREAVRDESTDARRRRVRWWSALALLRAIGSSPAAAKATLENRANNVESATVEEADELGRRSVLDEPGDEEAESLDTSPGVLAAGEDEAEAEVEERIHPDRRRLLELASAADALRGEGDPKLIRATALVKKLLADGFSPIVFCRFIDTAEYVAEHLREVLGGRVEVAAVTGRLAPAEREQRIEELADHPKHVLVATDCLSEGINLQEGFDAVLHYDLAWNPTRHEQREGRVDRFGQTRPQVRVITFYGSNNPVDGAVLKVLLEKHRKIRDSLGISVPVPVDAAKVGEAILEDLILRGREDESIFEQLTLIDTLAEERRHEFEGEWDAAAERESRSRTMFAQRTIKVDEVERELSQARAAVGSGVEVERFVLDALTANHARISTEADGHIEVMLDEVPTPLREAIGVSHIAARFDVPHDGAVLLDRTHPIVQALAAYTLDTALDPLTDHIASRCAVLRTDAVERRTTLLLLRVRIHLNVPTPSGGRELLAEEAQIVACSGSANDPEWLDPEAAQLLLNARPVSNIAIEQQRDFAEGAIEDLTALQPALDHLGHRYAAEVLDAHRRVRDSARARGTPNARAQTPVDVLGVAVLLARGAA